MSGLPFGFSGSPCLLIVLDHHLDHLQFATTESKSAEFLMLWWPTKDQFPSWVFNGRGSYSAWPHVKASPVVSTASLEDSESQQTRSVELWNLSEQVFASDVLWHVWSSWIRQSGDPCNPRRRSKKSQTLARLHHCIYYILFHWLMWPRFPCWIWMVKSMVSMDFCSQVSSMGLGQEWNSSMTQLIFHWRCHTSHTLAYVGG